MKESILQAESLELFRNDIPIYSNISFKLIQGQHLVLSGSNGSGKTTLIRTLCCLTNQSSGCIKWNKSNVDSIDNEYLDHIAYLGHKNGLIDDSIVTAASFCGITEMFKIGGAQAIAALAYGTDSVNKVDKVFGPGNSFVTMAKTILASTSEIAIDMPAGPTEVLVISDGNTEPDYVAYDLLSQAEH